jgi:prephenate dehydrogenase
VAVLATELGINIFDVEIAHSVEGDRGVLVVVIDVQGAPTLTEALTARGHRSSTSPVGTIR